MNIKKIIIELLRVTDNFIAFKKVVVADFLKKILNDFYNSFC